MRRFLLHFLLLLAAAPVAAQPVPPAAATLDTVAALHRLFAARRERRTIVVVSTLAAGVVGAAVVSSTPASATGGGGYGSFSGPVINDQAIKAFGVGIATVPVVLAELLIFGGWGRRQEQRTIEAWQQHRLPRHFRRRLKAKDFQ